jgi:hypothetical protein
MFVVNHKREGLDLYFTGDVCRILNCIAISQADTLRLLPDTPEVVAFREGQAVLLRALAEAFGLCLAVGKPGAVREISEKI